LKAWLDDADRCAALELRFTELHLTLRQDTAQKAAEAILPYLNGRTT